MTSITARAHSAIDQGRAQPGALAAGGCAVAALALQRPLQVHAPGLKRRHHAEEQAGTDRHDQRDRQHAEIDGDVGDARDVGRRERDEHPNTQHGQSRAKRRRNHGEQKAFGRELTHQPRPGRPKRGAHGHFAAARRAARQEQVGHVRARDEQDEAHGGQQHEQRRTDRPEDDSRQRFDEDAARQVFGICALQICGDRRELLLCRGNAPPDAAPP